MHAGGQTRRRRDGGRQTRTSPQIRGTVTLSQGNLARLRARGVNLSHINAQRSTAARARCRSRASRPAPLPGPVVMTGSVGVLQAGIPVDLKITASNAQPVSRQHRDGEPRCGSSSIRGTARERLDRGRLHPREPRRDRHPRRAAAGRRRPRRAAPRPSALHRRRGSNGRIDAGCRRSRRPRQILVQGRGLDAELGSERGLHIGGTARCAARQRRLRAAARHPRARRHASLNLQTTPPGQRELRRGGPQAHHRSDAGFHDRADDGGECHGDGRDPADQRTTRIRRRFALTSSSDPEQPPDQTPGGAACSA
jgi:hypothetical protein